MNAENKLYTSKMEAWLKQTELSIADSANRICFHEGQISIAQETIAACKKQLDADTDALDIERKRFEAWKVEIESTDSIPISELEQRVIALEKFLNV